MKKNLIIISVSLAIVLGGGFALAKPIQNVKATEAKSTATRVKALKSLQRCEVVEAKVENKISTFEMSKNKHLVSYNKTKEKIQRFITRLDDKGYDTAKLKEDLIGYDAKIKKFSSDYATYISLLRETKQYTCGKSEGEFKAKLEAAREQLKLVHNDAVEIRTYFAKTVRPDILAIKDQTPKTKTETEGSED